MSGLVIAVMYLVAFIVPSATLVRGLQQLAEGHLDAFVVMVIVGSLLAMIWVGRTAWTKFIMWMKDAPRVYY